MVSGTGVEKETLRRMARVLAHRGPDEETVQTYGSAGLGHRRLSIIDLDHGSQPIANEDDTVSVVFNGEIYNHESLRADLEQRGHRFKTRCDTEVLVHLYEEYGRDCVCHLRGMFAFAIWDDRRQRLFAARDHLGQKPFFYVHRKGTFVFGSEIKALLSFDPSLAKLDRAALDQYLTLRIITPPRSMFTEIRKLPPAHRLTFDLSHGLSVDRYWDLNFEPKFEGTEDDLVDELEQRLLDSLKLHLVSDVPVGAFLSGGLDSTLIVAMLTKHGLYDRIQTFSMGLPLGDFDEAPYARQVADRYQTQHHEQTIVPSLLDTLPRLIWHLDEPSDALAICSYLIAQMARDRVKVVLGGDGGDELFGGYDRYYGHRYAGYYAWVPKSIRRHVMGPLMRSLPDGKWYKSRAHQLKWIHALSFAQGGERYARSLGYFYFDKPRRDALYGPVMREAADDFDPEEAVRESFARSPAHDPVDRMLHTDVQLRLPDHSVMILDRMTMAHGLEARSPLMDHRLAEFAARLPVSCKVRGRSLRRIQVRLAERYLPRDVLDRPKQGFSSALPYLLGEELGLLFETFLRDAHLAREGLLNQAPIDRLLIEQRAGAADHGTRLWLLLNAEVWYRMFIERASIDEVLGQISAVANGDSR